MFHTSIHQFLSLSPKHFIECVANDRDLEEQSSNSKLILQELLRLPMDDPI